MQKIYCDHHQSILQRELLSPHQDICHLDPIKLPLPQKGENPEDHILKVEDYFEIHEIKKEKNKTKRFKDTLFETVIKWAQTLNYTKAIKFDYDSKDKNDKKASMKYLLLQDLLKKVELWKQHMTLGAH